MKEKNTYQRLFNIDFNNKEFTIFLDKYGRKTFLEIDKEGNYKYPDINDFIELHKIYNEIDPFVFYSEKDDGLPIHKPKRVIFKEAVLKSPGIIPIILAGVISVSSFAGFKLEKNNGAIEVKPSSVVLRFDDSKTLDEYIGVGSVSDEELIDAINSNPNLDELYKERAILLAKYIKEKYPYTDNRIFYENMKTLKIGELEDNEQNKHIAGEYNSYFNIIKIKNKSMVEETSAEFRYSFENETILHELAHAYHTWSLRSNYYSNIYRSSKMGYSFNEAMNNRVIAGLFEDETRTYVNEEKILNYLLTFVSYDYYDYEQGGIDKLYNLLKEKYPAVDIDYIFNFSDTMCTTRNHQGINIKIEEENEFLDCLFDLCVRNIDYSKPYESLINFFEVIDYSNYPDIITNYTNIYNEVLINHEYKQELMNSDQITNYLKEMNNLRLFDRYLNKLSLDDISSGNIYLPLKKYLDSNTATVSYNNIFCEILKKYNEFLITNGISDENIVTEQEFMNKLEKYKDVYFTGYSIMNDGSIYLSTIKQGDENNQESRVSILDKNGEIILCDENSIQQTAIVDGIQSNFYWYILTNPQDDLSWYDYFFEKEYMSPFEYKKVDITVDGKLITHDYLNNLVVTIGVNENGTKSYKLTTKDGNKLYYNGNPVVKISFNLMDFISTKYKDSLELNEFFNDEYLKKFILDDNKIDIPDKEYISYDATNDKIIIKQKPTVILNNDTENEIDISSIYMAYYGDDDCAYLNVCGKRYLLNSDSKLDKLVYLSDVLNYYGLDDEAKLPYKFSIDEIINLFSNYLNDVYDNLTLLTLNGKEIRKVNINDLIVTIGMNADGSNSFKLNDLRGYLLYKNGNPVVKVQFKLTDYLNESEDQKVIELSKIFSKEYLKQFAKSDKEISYKDYVYYDENSDRIKIKQRQTVIVDGDSENEILMGLIYISPLLSKETSQNILIINNEVCILNIECPIEKQINLYDVLNYYGLYDEANLPYKFSTDEIINLFSNYLQDMLNMKNNEELNTEYSMKM